MTITAIAAADPPAPKPTPTFAEQLLPVLPDHTYTTASFGAWSATWTTPTGAWFIACNFGSVTIRGPLTKITRDQPNAPLAIALLRTLGAIA